MMFSNKLVCSVKIDKKILREKIEGGNSTVFIPFGSEYSLILKNLAGRNAVVHIEIDGKEVAKDGFYLRAGATAEIEGFINCCKADRKFKFIQKTQEISDFRGDKVDDGMIRVTWQFEKEKVIKKTVIEEIIRTWPRYEYCYRCNRWHYTDESCHPRWRPYYDPYVTYTFNADMMKSEPLIGSSTSTSKRLGDHSYSSSRCFIGSALNMSSENPSAHVHSDEGITVEGSKSGQSFGTAYADELEENTHSMVILLKGVQGSQVVQKPVLVRDKKQCPSCGRRYKGNIEFCPRDGTALK